MRKLRMSAGRWALAALSVSTLVPVGAVAESRVEIILDASGSMWAKVGGEEKITAAKRIVRDWLADVKLPPDSRVGLTVYGHRTKADCQDIEHFPAVTYDQRTSLIPEVEKLSPKGKTPIADTLSVVGETLKQHEGPTSILLVSDGIESCGHDPCAVARRLREQYGINVTIHVVGFNVSEGQEQLQCIAREGGGKYFNAVDAKGLATAFEDVKAELIKADTSAMPPEVPTESVKTVALLGRGRIQIPNLHGRIIEVCRQGTAQHCTSDSPDYAGQIIPGPNALGVSAGSYRLQFDNVFLENVEVKAGNSTVVQVGVIRIPHFSEIAANVCRQDVAEKCDSSSAGYVGNILRGPNALEVPAGTYKIQFENQLMENVAVEAGQTVLLE